MFGHPAAARILLFAGIALTIFFAPALAEEAAEFFDPWRLDPVASPDFQFVELQLDPGERTYTGSTRIEMTLHEDTDRIDLILRPDLEGAERDQQLERLLDAEIVIEDVPLED